MQSADISYHDKNRENELSRSRNKVLFEFELGIESSDTIFLLDVPFHNEIVKAIDIIG